MHDTAAPATQNYLVAQVDQLRPVECPCGHAQRAFAVSGNDVATLHLVDVSVDARTHYHKRMTEIYLVLEGEGFIELDGTLVPVKPMTSVLIRPGCRHRAVGKMRIVNVPIPAFDPTDEFED